MVMIFEKQQNGEDCLHTLFHFEMKTLLDLLAGRSSNRRHILGAVSVFQVVLLFLVMYCPDVQMSMSTQKQKQTSPVILACDYFCTSQLGFTYFHRGSESFVVYIIN